MMIGKEKNMYPVCNCRMFIVDNMYYIYIYCRKIYNLFVWTLEIGRKVSIWQAFLSCFTESVNNLGKDI